MARAPFGKLTRQQIECLRLAAGGDTSKEIARKLGLTPAAIDDRFARAVTALGAANRRQAVRWFEEFEGRAAKRTTPDFPSSDAPERVMPDPPVLDFGLSGGMLSSSATGANGGRQTQVGEVNEARVAFDHSLPLDQAPSQLLPYRRGPGNELTTKQRLTWILLIALGIMIAIGAFLGGLDALARIFAATHPHP